MYNQMLPCTGEEKLIVQAVESLSPCFQMLVVQSAPRDAFHKIQSLSEQHLHCCLENVIKNDNFYPAESQVLPPRI